MKKILFGILAVALIVGLVSCNNEDPPHEYNIVKKDFGRLGSQRPTIEELQFLLENGNEYGCIDMIKLIPMENWRTAASSNALNLAHETIIVPMMDESRVTGYGTISVPQNAKNQLLITFPNAVETFNQFGFILYGIQD